MLREIDPTIVDCCPTPDEPLPELDFVRIADLRVNESYQRPIEKRGRANVYKIAKHFQWGRFSPLLVARIDGGLFAIIDGQHRAHAAAACGLEKVPALIVDLNLQEQASAFTWVNGSVTALTPIQVYRAALAALETWAVTCDAAVTRAGCKLMTYNKSSANKKPGEIYAIAAVRRYVDRADGKDMAPYLIAVLAGLRKSANGQDAKWYGSMTLSALVPAAWEFGVTEPSVITGFLDAHDLDEIELRARRVKAKPEYAQESFTYLFNNSVRILLKAYLRGEGPE